MRIKEDQRGASNAIAFVLGLVIVVAIASNVFLWNYQMNQLDHEKMREEVTIIDVVREINGTSFTFENTGPVTGHLVSLWVINSTVHRRYDMDVIMNSGETLPYLRADISLPSGSYTVKVVTERGNLAIYSGS